jgi:hypothetical protein
MSAVAERTEMHKLINSIWNKEKLPEVWKESIIIPIYKKGYKTDCSNYRHITLLSTTYKILSNILLSGLTPYAEEIIGINLMEAIPMFLGTVKLGYCPSNTT